MEQKENNRFSDSKSRMSKDVDMTIYSVCVAAARYRLNRSLSEGFRVKKFRTNNQSRLRVQMMEIVIAVNGSNIKKAENILN